MTAVGRIGWQEWKSPQRAVPAGLYKNEPNATERGCYRNISDEQAIKAAKTGGLVAPTFTEWMMDGIWPDDITPKQAADMIDYLVKLIGVDHVGIASDDMFVLNLVTKFAKENPESYDDQRSGKIPLFLS